MNIEMEIIGDILVVKIFGEIDHHGTIEAKNTIDNFYKKNACRNIIFDLDNVTFADSSGIALLMGRHNMVCQNDGCAVVCNCHKLLKRILEMAGVFGIINNKNSLYEAIIFLGGDI